MKINKLFLAIGTTAMVLTTSCKTKEFVQQQHTTTHTTTETTITYNGKALTNETLDGNWIITQALGSDVIGDGSVHIIFDTKDGIVIGNNGCNTFNGKLNIGNANQMSFSDCITTLMACRPEVTDGNVMMALGRTTHYTVLTEDKQETTIALLDDNNIIVATLTRDPHNLLNGVWNIISVDGSKVHLEPMPSIAFDINSGTFSGNSGCNYMNGNINYDSSEINFAVRLTDAVSTRRMCEPKAMEIEDKVLNTINKVDAFRVINDKRIELYNTDNNHNNIVLERQ